MCKRHPYASNKLTANQDPNRESMVVGTDHDAKKRLKKDSYAKLMRAKNQRLDRHSGTGRSRVESPKKGGCGGKTVWGSYKDDIADFFAYRS